jgi:hypothetical protein
MNLINSILNNTSLSSTHGLEDPPHGTAGAQPSFGPDSVRDLARISANQPRTFGGQITYKF